MVLNFQSLAFRKGIPLQLTDETGKGTENGNKNLMVLARYTKSKPWLLTAVSYFSHASCVKDKISAIPQYTFFYFIQKSKSV